MELSLNFNKSVEENAAIYFEKAKKAKKKIAGARIAIEKAKEKLELIEKENAKEEPLAVKERRTLDWYEKFRWFYSSEDFLVIGGRDATTNEIVIKKHMQKEDIVFHTDMAGSPFFVIKCEGKKPSNETLQETADATACFSRAWKLGMATTEVFHVSPEQVSKTAESGEYMAKGAFMIRGKVAYIKPNMQLAVGLKDGKIMCAAVNAVKKHCKKYFMLEQGEKKPSDIAKLVKKEIGGEIDEIIRCLPSGNIKIDTKYPAKYD